MKKKLFVVAILVIFLLIGCTYGLTPTIESEEENIAATFIEQFPEVNSEHSFVEIDEYEVVRKLRQEEKAIIFFGFEECPKCHHVAIALAEAAIDNELDRIDYFNPFDIRNRNTREYQEIVEFLADILPDNEKGQPTLNVPLVVFIDEGEIVFYHMGSVRGASTRENVLTDEQQTALMRIFDNKIKQFVIEED